MVESLPRDILNLIPNYLDPTVSTLLDKRCRDQYFNKYGLVIDYNNIPYIDISLEKYNISLFKFDQADILQWKNKNLKTRVRKIHAKYLCNIEMVIEEYPNIKEINGILAGTMKNIELLKQIKNNMMIMILYSEELLLYRDLGLSNKLYITFTRDFKPEHISGIEDQIYGMCDGLILDREYPNLEELTIANKDSLSRINKNRFPRLRLVFAEFNIEKKDIINFLSDYPDLKIFIESVYYRRWNYLKYKSFVGVNLIFRAIYRNQFAQIKNFQYKLRSEHPDHDNFTISTDISSIKSECISGGLFRLENE